MFVSDTVLEGDAVDDAVLVLEIEPLAVREAELVEDLLCVVELDKEQVDDGADVLEQDAPED